MLNSLPRKLMLAISLWLLGALFCVGITLNITWRLKTVALQSMKQGHYANKAI